MPLEAMLEKIFNIMHGSVLFDALYVFIHLI